MVLDKGPLNVCSVVCNISATTNARDFKFCTHVKSSECSLSGNGRGQGHVSNFYIVDLENFATVSRRYTGDIDNSTVIGLFMTPIGQRKRLKHVTVEFMFIYM